MGVSKSKTADKKKLTLYLINISKKNTDELKPPLVMKFVVYVDINTNTYKRSTDVMLKILELLNNAKGEKTFPPQLWNIVREGRLEPNIEADKTVRVFAFIDKPYYMDEREKNSKKDEKIEKDVKGWKSLKKSLKKTFSQHAEVEIDYEDKWSKFVKSTNESEITAELKKNKRKVWNKYAATATGVGLTAAGIYGLHKIYKHHNKKKNKMNK